MFLYGFFKYSFCSIFSCFVRSFFFFLVWLGFHDVFKEPLPSWNSFVFKAGLKLLVIFILWSLKHWDTEPVPSDRILLLLSLTSLLLPCFDLFYMCLHISKFIFWFNHSLYPNLYWILMKMKTTLYDSHKVLCSPWHNPKCNGYIVNCTCFHILKCQQTLRCHLTSLMSQVSHGFPAVLWLGTFHSILLWTF